MLHFVLIIKYRKRSHLIQNKVKCQIITRLNHKINKNWNLWKISFWYTNEYSFYKRYREICRNLFDSRLSTANFIAGTRTVIAQILILADRKISHAPAIYKCKFHYVRLSRCGLDCVRVRLRMLVISVKLEHHDAYGSQRWDST